MEEGYLLSFILSCWTSEVETLLDEGEYDVGRVIPDLRRVERSESTIERDCEGRIEIVLIKINRHCGLRRTNWTQCSGRI